jgi:hypothetical protein
MQTLIFDTKNKKTTLHAGHVVNTDVLFSYNDTPTVQVRDGFYEVMYKPSDVDKAIPVLRVPISNTNMIIKNL